MGWVGGWGRVSRQLANAVVPFHLRHDGAWLRDLGWVRVRVRVRVRVS